MATAHIIEHDIDTVAVIALSGRLVLGDGDSALREHIDALLARGRSQVVLNLHDVTYIDSCGIGALVAALVKLRRVGGDLKLVCPSGRCEHVLALTHVLSLFSVYATDDDAVRSFALART